MESHLSSEQLERVLAGKAEPHLMEHVTACAACTAEIACFGTMFGELRDSAAEMAAAQRQTAVVVRPVVRHARRVGAWALAAVVFAAVVVPVALHRPAVKVPVVAGPVSGSAGDAAVAAVSDAELMTYIQNDLSSNVPEPMQALEGTDNNTGSNRNTNSN